MTRNDPHRSRRSEFLRYVLNGLFATLVHYFVLSTSLLVLDVASAGAANFLASFFGIATSYWGNRCLVFHGSERSIRQQALRFMPLYFVLAVMNGIVLFLWTDLLAFDYRTGFLIALALQVVIGYIANKHLVFV